MSDDRYFCEMSEDEYISASKAILNHTDYIEIEIVGNESAVVYLSEDTAIKFAKKILNI